MKPDDFLSRTPIWFKVLIVITALPLLAWPRLIGKATIAFDNRGDDALPWVFVMLLPLYVVLSTWISYRIYPQWRALAWVLQALQVLVYVALWVMVQYGSRIV